MTVYCLIFCVYDRQIVLLVSRLQADVTGSMQIHWYLITNPGTIAQGCPLVKVPAKSLILLERQKTGCEEALKQVQTRHHAAQLINSAE